MNALAAKKPGRGLLERVSEGRKFVFAPGRELKRMESMSPEATGALWTRSDLEDPLKLSRGIHVQLTEDLTFPEALRVDSGGLLQTRVREATGRTGRGTALLAPQGSPVSRPEGESAWAGDFTYSLLLAALLEGGRATPEGLCGPCLPAVVPSGKRNLESGASTCYFTERENDL